MRPRITALTPSVKIIEGTRKYATPMPLTSPTRSPMPSPIGIASGPPIDVAIMAAAASVHGTDRSIWAIRITIIIPAATMPRKAPICSCCSR